MWKKMSFFSFLKAYYFKIWLPFQAAWVRICDFFAVTILYIRHPKFLLSYFILTLFSLRENPYRTSFKFHQGKTENPYQFGTTPLITLDRIVTKVGILSDDIVLELGSGTGHTLLWLCGVVKCHAIGVEWVPQFVKDLQWIKNWFRLENLEIRQEDYLKTDYSQATAIYLYGTCMHVDEIKIFCSRLGELKKGCKIITVTFPLTDYTDYCHLQLIDVFSLTFPWGRSKGFLHRITSD